jgi:Ca2+/Na+ antiporter
MEPYHIEKRGDTVVLSTTSFRTERRSVLHSGVFNRELAASLAAGGVIIVVSFFFVIYSKVTAVHFAAAAFLFAVLFILFRIYVFREPVLETSFDRERKTITVRLKRAVGSKVEAHPLDGLSGIRIDHISMEPENIDAVRLVERVAVQHGTVIPGFGKTEDFYTVELDLRNKAVVIFSSREKRMAESVLNELKDFLSRTYAS